MTRIIAGRVGGRRLATPRGRTTRPTSDRVREALFSTVAVELGALDGLRVLDLYAGSGALGLEAWSRGAGVVTFVESDRRTAALVAANARDLGVPRADVRTQPVSAVLDRPPPTPYDLVLSDPPYPLPGEAVDADLAALVQHGWLCPDALVVVERSSRTPGPRWPGGLQALRERRYGETTLWYATSPGPSTQPEPRPDEPLEETP